ncbi:MAG TPA: SUMF1/EgtB/PvdO family nonheme iron enzyme [Saprospiraceae bacterium]|nr:SUMF1/EgtB/PvdO family nonheme iron enzyme [Saprospiraceae bacterium]
MLFTLFILCLFNYSGKASDVVVKNEILYSEGNGDSRQIYALMHLEWKNAWRNEINHDAVWVFCKFLRGENGYRHIKLKNDGHQIVLDYLNTGQKFEIEVPDDGNGLFIRYKDRFRGDVSLKIKLALDMNALGNFNPNSASFKAYAIEMVHIPQGSFYVGEKDSTTANRYSSLYQPDKEGNHNGFLHINSEKALTAGLDFAYKSRQPLYQGDEKGIVPESFPKGFKAFYIMKYEITQGEYAAFLNSLSREQSQLRNNFGGKGYEEFRGSISLSGNEYVAVSPNRPCNFLSWDDAMAFADWSALRPITELEFEKASRGPVKPEANDFPWGNAHKSNVERFVDSNGDLVHLKGKSESFLTHNNRVEFGASYYWVMDLAGSLWERCITLGDSEGRAFQGTHGDGTISSYGFATNDDWPRGADEKGGFGFRGGGFYHHGRLYHEFNPYSPVSYRPYGAWSGGNRTEAYGSRLARTIGY